VGRLTQSARPATRWVDELDWAFGWVSPERSHLQITSHALLAGGGVWVIDPSTGDGVEERIRALGEPAGVIQLLNRHARSCASFARRLRVPHHAVPFLDVGPFEAIPVARSRHWREAALWWPERRVLVCADALGTVPHYFALDGERLGVHPLLRLRPPRQLGRPDPEHVLCGHGSGVHDGAAEAVRHALAGSRRRLPRLLLELPAALRS
jgi:hypothetical protein